MRPRTSWSPPSRPILRRCVLSADAGRPPSATNISLPTQLTVTIRLHRTPAGRFRFDGPTIGPAGRERPAGPVSAPGLGLLGLPEDLVDLFDLAEQLVGLGDLDGALCPGCTSQLGGFIEELVQLRILRKVRWLEIVGP